MNPPNASHTLFTTVIDIFGYTKVFWARYPAKIMQELERFARFRKSRAVNYVLRAHLSMAGISLPWL
jgi:hypothetical protein